MSTLSRRVAVEVYTAMSRITGGIRTPHLHIRDELNDPRLSLLIFYEMEVAALSDLRSPRLVSDEAWLRKDEVLLAVPRKAKGSTPILAQRTIESRLGRNEHRLLLEVPPSVSRATCISWASCWSRTRCVETAAALHL